MNIIFDVHIANPNLPNEIGYEENIILNELFVFVEEKIKWLEKEIDAEEKLPDGKPKATVIYLKSSAIQPQGYTKPLCDKIVACFSRKDVEAMWLRVENSLKDLLN